MHKWIRALGVRHELLAASILWTGCEQVGKEGTGTQGGLGQQLKASRALSEVQDSCGQCQSPPCACTCCCDMKTLCCSWDRLQVLQLLFVPFSGPPTNAMAHLGGNTRCLHAEPWHLLPTAAGQAALGSPLHVPSPAVPPQLRGQGTPALLGAEQLLCSCQTARVAVWAVPRGCCADDGFVSVCWSASCTQSPPQSISPFPPPL